jgi:ribosome-binding protein aMBF1 (putative translation factor)
MKRKRLKSADKFFESLLQDDELRMFYEEERAKTQLAMAIKAARQKAKLTQAELAKKVKTTQSVIARLESGSDSRVPSLPVLARIAAACNGVLEVGFKLKKAS